MGAVFLSLKKLELRISRILYAMIIHLGWMLPSTSSGYLGKRRAHLIFRHLPCSRWGLPSSISHLMDWCAFTAPFHLYNALRRCSLLSVALSIALPLLGVTQHPALRSPDFPHPNCKLHSGRDHLLNSSLSIILYLTA